MQTPSRLAVSGGGGSSSSSASEADKLEAVIRELTLGHELTAQLRPAALRALRGQGQAEATAAFILQEVSRAFTVCLSIMSSRAPPPTAPEQPAAAAAAAEMPAPPATLTLAPRRSRDDSIPREQRRTSSPHYDGYQWRKYGQKRITKTPFPRCYFKCSYHRERNCRATKQVQQCSGSDPPQYLVMYFNEHTCDTADWMTTEPAANSAGMPPLVDDLLLPAGGLLARQAPLLDNERGAQEEHERRLLVSSLACVLGAQQHQFQQQSPAGSGSTTAAAVVVNVGGHHEQEQEPPRTRDAPGEIDHLDVDVMDYDVTDALCLADCYDLPVPDSDDGFRPF